MSDGYGKQLRILVHIYWFLIFVKPENYLNLLKKCWEGSDKEAATQTYKKHRQKKLQVKLRLNQASNLRCKNKQPWACSYNHISKIFPITESHLLFF